MPASTRSQRSSTPPLSGSPKGKREEKIFRESIPEFDPSDFHGWAFQMEILMSAAKCYGAIDHSSNQWLTKSAEKREEMACKASLFINLSLGPEYRHICVAFKPKQAKELYEKIKNMFIKNDVETRMMLTE